MSVHLHIGATNKESGKHENPIRASKANKYECPECKRDVILRQGEIKRAHFAHKASNYPCSYYEKPSEAQIHKDAKRRLKSLLETGASITVKRLCYKIGFKKREQFDIPSVSECSKIVLEHRFQYNGLKIADVAYLTGNEIFCIFEILNTSRTKEENRPGEWFELKAEDVINAVDAEHFECQRNVICEECTKGEKRWSDVYEFHRFSESFRMKCKREKELNIKLSKEKREREEEQERQRRAELREMYPDYDSDYEQDFRFTEFIG